MDDSVNEQISLQVLKQHFNHISMQLQDILYEFRNLVLAIRPDASERVDAYGLSFFDDQRGGIVKGAIAIAHVAEDHLQVHFIYGALLPDPMGLLDGGLDAKYKRFARIYSMESTDWQALGDIVRAQNEYVQLRQ